MADPSHLDRLGRELKCPICLSLLTTAVSLSCNHVFCKDCIDKSMKSASSCPVCKIPYRRREIRPAPHMDNLVSVYKSMEVASGVNMFITQAAAASTKISGEGILIGVDTPKVPDNDQTQVQNINYTHKKQHQIKGSKNASVSTQLSSQSKPENLSFPTKKRVLVPLYQTSGVQTEHKKLENIFGETDRKQPKKLSVPLKDMSLIVEEGEPRLSPFFWLRDEDDSEKSSQQTDNHEDMFTPPDAPCFSDLKDSDDERGMGSLRNRNDFFDSELFDWTQRPCSPELCPSPMAMQVEDSAEQSGAQQKVETVATEITTKPKNCSNKKSYLSKKRKNGKFSVLKSGMDMSNKKLSSLTDIRKTKRAKKSLCEGTGHDVESNSVRNEDIPGGSKVNQLISKGKQRKNRKAFPDACFQEEKIPNQCEGAEPLPNSKRILTSGVSASENSEKSNRKQSKLKTSGESGKSTRNRLSKRGKFGSKVKLGKSGTGNGDMVTETENEVPEPVSGTNLLPIVSEDVMSRGITRASKEVSGKLSKFLKMAKFSAEGTSKDNCAGLSLNIDEEDARRCNSNHEIGNVTDQLRLKVPAKMDKAVSSLNRGVLLKCTTSPGSFHCAFCQSSEDSEVAGSMAHYLKGKLVADNHNAIKDAIHVHKNCTEWAPNVYFEDDNVINLEAELSRSKRIRCSCCGIKGAALGCYEKSCRKSFHVTCAKLTPECRWDFENFVMLCPVHASCPLPNEMARSQSSRKRKSAPERKCTVYKAKEANECESDSIKQWKSQKKLKSLVLCCSALNSTEMGVVNELESLAGVTILKNWDSTVTHVIVSTDENGACRRTLKYLMGVLEGKWILSVEWIKACIGAREIVDEQHYEISIDIHGIKDGPRLGRLRLINKQPKLFDGFSFFFTGDFEPSYKGYLHELIIAAGGKVLNRKPVGGNAISLVKNSAKTFIIYSIELPDQSRPSNTSSILNHRRAQAEALAGPSGSMIASNSWVLNSIAGHKALI